VAIDSPPLDLLSTSQTSVKRCVFGAPLVALIIEGKSVISYGCCNHWECPRCGELRAKQEYRRIVNGCEVLSAKHKLYFWTITCRGRELSYETAETNYLKWTNRLLTNSRTKARREDAHWCYVQVTEHQKKTRAHPHSHLITTFLPMDATISRDRRGREVYVSEWFSKANYSAGLGSEHTISQVRTPAAVSRYVAKYMFKDAMKETWRKGWKRVRYSQNFPKLPERRPDFAQPLNAKSDWYEVGEMNKIRWLCETDEIYEMARHRIANIIRPSG